MNAAEISFHLHGRKSGAGYIARCPAHDDREPSLSLRDAEGKILALFRRMRTGQRDRCAEELGLWPEPKPTREPKRRLVASYQYTDAAGALLYEVLRYAPKTFKQRYPNGGGGWIWKKHPHQVLYHLREVLENPIIFVVEGERDPETLRDYGFVATTNSGGAEAPWLPQFTDALRGREAILVPDNDAPGRRRVLRIARTHRRRRETGDSHARGSPGEGR